MSGFPHVMDAGEVLGSCRGTISLCGISLYAMLNLGLSYSGRRQLSGCLRVVTASSPTSTSPGLLPANHNFTQVVPTNSQNWLPLVDSIAAQSLFILFIPLHPLHLHPLNSYTLSPLTTLSHQSSPFCTLLSLVMHLTHSNITPNSLCTSYGIHIGCFGHNRT